MVTTTPTWRQPGFHAAAEAWVEEQVAVTGAVLTGPVEQPHDRPWSTALRVPTDRGLLWFKANGAGTAYEPLLVRELAAAGVPGVVMPVAVDPERGWWLMPHAGERLRESEPTLASWSGALASYADVQRSSERLVPRLLAVGVPDWSPARLPGLLAELLDDPAVVEAGVRALLPQLADWCAELAESRVPLAVEHGDLHDGNVAVQGDGFLFFDWGDAAIGHPFGTLLVALRSVAARFELSPGDEQLRWVRDGYLERWTDVCPRAQLERQVELALRVGPVCRALSWRKALVGASEVDLAAFGEAVPGWLGELLGPVVS